VDAGALLGLLGAVIVGIFSLYGVRYSMRAQERSEERTREEVAEQLLRQYRDPLVRAAFDLQSRLYNIIANDFLTKYFLKGTPDEQEYARESTLYVVSEYFGWVELMRREVQFLDLRDMTKNRELAERLDDIGRTFLAERPDKTFRVFRGEQRAIGEMMLTRRTGRSRECIGYATFIVRREDPAFSRWFQKLSGDIDVLAREPGLHEDRLLTIQHAVIDLIDFLDPTGQYFPPSQRQKIGPPSSYPASAAAAAPH
jgi:hypothetical protein